MLVPLWLEARSLDGVEVAPVTKGVGEAAHTKATLPRVLRELPVVLT